jgi:hypothetical protein
VASTDSVAADADLLIPTRIREFAAKIRGVAESVPLSDDYPLLAGAMCHSWKQRAGLAGHLFAAQERVTAICSLDTVVQCHRLVIIALTPLLLPETQEALMNFSEVLVGFSRYAQVHSIRKLSGSIVAPESVAVAIEKFRWDAVVYPSEMPSACFKGVLDHLGFVHARLKELFAELPFVGAQRLLEHVALNVMVGAVEGMSRVRKFSDSGRRQMYSDVEFITRTVKTMYPWTKSKILEYAKTFAKAMTVPFQQAFEMLPTIHVLYSAKQIVSIGEKEGFLRKRDVEQLLSRLQHEDKSALHLLE